MCLLIGPSVSPPCSSKSTCLRMRIHHQQLHPEHREQNHQCAAHAATVNKWLDDTTKTVNELFGFANITTNAIHNTIVTFLPKHREMVFDGTAFARLIPARCRQQDAAGSRLARRGCVAEAESHLPPALRSAPCGVPELATPNPDQSAAIQLCLASSPT